MVISISGPAGSGKTTIARLIAARFHLEHVYAGQMIRDMADRQGMSIYQFNEYVEGHPEIDREVDETIVRKAREGNKVVEGRLAGWMMVRNTIDALKLFFTIDAQVAAARVALRDHLSIDDALHRNADRERRHWERFRKLYGADRDDLSIYDAVIDTSSFTVEQNFAQVEKLIQERYRV